MSIREIAIARGIIGGLMARLAPKASMRRVVVMGVLSAAIYYVMEKRKEQKL